MNFLYWDQLGANHSFPVGITNWQAGSPCGGGPNLPSGTANDGSGYTLSAGVSGSSVSTTLRDRSRENINAPQQKGTGTGSVTDTNGNLISVSNNGSSTTFFDTLNSTTPALTVTGAGTPSSPYNYAYTNPSGGTSSYKLNYTNYSVRTNFGCSGIVEYNSASQPLVSSISRPDGTAYSFTYESTPGFPSSVTGRLHSVTLPTGETITYSYSGGNNGITCGDGSAAALARATPDGTWTYAHSASGTAWTTTVTDPQSNQTAMQFQTIYETQRKIYQGPTTGTLLRTVDTCYNGSTSPCTGTGVTLPITSVSAVTSLPGTTTLQSKVVASYTGYGLPTEIDEYDLGSGAPGSLVRKTTYSGSLGNIVDHPTLAQIFDGSGTLIAQTSYGYDQTAVTATSGTPQHISVSGSRGNLTTVQRLVAGATNLTQTISYFDTGNINQSIDANSAQTGFSYGNCGNSFVSSISMPLSLSISQVWNCTGGVQTSATDANSKTTSWAFTDANFWRPTSTTDPTAAVTALSYFTSPNTGNESTLNFNGTTSTADARTTLDGLGRTHVTQQKQSQTSGNYDSVETDYDVLGRPTRITVPYTGTAGQTNSTIAGTITTYDALGRPLTVTDGGGGVTTYTYTQNDVLVTVGPAPAGENTKRRQLEYDGLGRLKSVCEITAAAGSGNCGQTVAQTGFLTKYTYDAQTT